MPVKPENRKRYPRNWKAIARAVKERADWACEGSPLYPECRAAHGHAHPVTDSRVILTTAHLDHTPENCDAANLKAWCQRCHLAYDAAHHAANASATWEAKRARKARLREKWRRAARKRRAVRLAAQAAFERQLRELCREDICA